MSTLVTKRTARTVLTLCVWSPPASDAGGVISSLKGEGEFSYDSLDPRSGLVKEVAGTLLDVSTTFLFDAAVDWLVAGTEIDWLLLE